MKTPAKHPDTATNECEFCDGTGEAQESCCGRPLNDMGICTDCGEHCDQAGDECHECGGTGVIKTTTK
jgi:hypothetical protein